MRLKLISCEVLYREMCASLARSPHQVDVEFLPKGLHDLGGTRMRERIQAMVDAVDESAHDAVLLGYALCGNGIVGLEARGLPVVIPRAHDCIALLVGGRDRYQEYFDRNPGVYYRSTGWLERGGDLQQVGHTLDELIARYGEDDGRYLFEELHGYARNYRKLTYIATGLEPDESFEQRAREEASRRGWKFERIEGSLCLFERLLNGDWAEEDFLVLAPGRRVAVTYDTDVIAAEGANELQNRRKRV